MMFNHLKIMTVVIMHLIVQPYIRCIVEVKQERIVPFGTENVIYFGKCNSEICTSNKKFR